MTTRPGQEPLPIEVSLDDPEPMYRQIVEQVRGLILSGMLTAGTALPSVRALASDLSCSVITTRRAYQELEASGLIRTRQGMGTTVAELSPEMVAQSQRGPVEAAMRETIAIAWRTRLGLRELREMFEAEVDRIYGNDEGSGT